MRIENNFSADIWELIKMNVSNVGTEEKLTKSMAERLTKIIKHQGAQINMSDKIK